jgi:predicted DNA-binding protein
MMTETATVKGRIRREAKDRLQDIVRESGRDEEDLVGEAVERSLNDDYWAKEISRRLAVPESEKRYVDPHEMDKWVQSLRDGKPISAPEAKPLSEL